MSIQLKPWTKMVSIWIQNKSKRMICYSLRHGIVGLIHRWMSSDTSIVSLATQPAIIRDRSFSCSIHEKWACIQRQIVRSIQQSSRNLAVLACFLHVRLKDSISLITHKRDISELQRDSRMIVWGDDLLQIERVTTVGEFWQGSSSTQIYKSEQCKWRQAGISKQDQCPFNRQHIVYRMMDFI